MKKSRTLPALLSLVLALTMMLSLSVTAFAASPARASGNGYSMTKIKISGRDYDIVASAGESQSRAYTGASCDGALDIVHSDLSAQFTTTHYGYISEKGGYKYARTTDTQRYTNSNYVECRYGAGEVEKIRYINGTVTFYGDTTETLTVTLKNP